MRPISSSSWYIFIIDKFDDNFNSFDKDSYAILEKGLLSWIQNNPCIKILEHALS